MAELNKRGEWAVNHPRATTAILWGIVVFFFALGLAIFLGIVFLAVQFIKFAWNA